MDNTLEKIKKIEALGELRGWGIRHHQVILRHKSIIHIARFGIKLYKEKYDILKLHGNISDDIIFDKLDNFLMDVIEEKLPDLGETNIVFFPTQNALDIYTKGKPSNKYTILFKY